MILIIEDFKFSDLDTEILVMDYLFKGETIQLSLFNKNVEETLKYVNEVIQDLGVFYEECRNFIMEEFYYEAYDEEEDALNEEDFRAELKMLYIGFGDNKEISFDFKGGDCFSEVVMSLKYKNGEFEEEIEIRG